MRGGGEYQNTYCEWCSYHQSFIRDMTPKQKFADLLEHVALVKNLKRLRFLTSHPK